VQLNRDFGSLLAARANRPHNSASDHKAQAIVFLFAGKPPAEFRADAGQSGCHFG
jgi:hypothetical protein